jgi:hypothetical protein
MKQATQVKVWDQGQWNWCELHDNGTWNGYIWDRAYDVPEAIKPFNGAPIVIYNGRRYVAATGLNSFD